MLMSRCSSRFCVRRFVWLCLCLAACCVARAQVLTMVELNCENLFDTRHDEGKDDLEFTPEGLRHWSRSRYWRKLNHTGQTILSCSSELPDLVALVEVENDTVLHDLTRRSLLRHANYDYVMTESPDERGVDVALLYSRFAFSPLCYETIGVPLVPGMPPTRDILYVKGVLTTCDTLHVFVIHFPSRYGGELRTRFFRRQAMGTLVGAIDSLKRLHGAPHIVIAGDFNDPLESPAMRVLQEEGGVESATRGVEGTHGARSNYRFRGLWEQIDHVFCSPGMLACARKAYVNDAPFLLEEDRDNGGVKPRRTFSGYRYQYGFSDHLPLVVSFDLGRLEDGRPTGSARAVRETR